MVEEIGKLNNIDVKPTMDNKKYGEVKTRKNIR